MKGEVNRIRNLIEGQLQVIAKAQKRIDELNQKILNLSNEKEIIKPVDNHNYCGKILYVSKKQADSARKIINRDLVKANKPPMLRSYFCNQCEAWHLTTIPHWSPYPENENAEMK